MTTRIPSTDPRLAPEYPEIQRKTEIEYLAAEDPAYQGIRDYDRRRGPNDRIPAKDWAELTDPVFARATARYERGERAAGRPSAR